MHCPTEQYISEQSMLRHRLKSTIKGRHSHRQKSSNQSAYLLPKQQSTLLSRYQHQFTLNSNQQHV